ncbi:MAG: B12-binding domain-containing radical SAM protein, partial [Planctomycetes bacterium]|nr:B12-binding domain-containing radical SAM protein [Planctomycetota bacterium]
MGGGGHKARALFAYAPHADTFGYSMPPPGLLRLGGTLEREGFEVALEDLAYRLGAGEVGGDDTLASSCAELLLSRGEFDVVGFSTMGATLPVSVAIAEHLRAAAPELRIVLGGPGTTGVDEALLERFPWIDACVRGEGEVTVPELLTRWGEGEGLAGVAGVTWRDGDGAIHREADRPQLKDLGELAPYARHLLPPLTDYKRITGEADGLTPIDSGRGCAYDCSFCTIGRFWSRRSRTLPYERLADEVCELQELEGARNAYLCHDLFGADREQAMGFCEEMIERGSPFPWEVRARLDHLDDELLAKMSAAGGYRVLFGVESADAEVLEACDKNTRESWDPMLAVERCAANGITPILSLVLGLPGEGDEELAASLELCTRAALIAGVNISLHLVNPQPGCTLGEEFAAEARPLDGVPPDMALGAGETGPERALIEAHPDLFSSFALLPQPEERLRELASISHTLPELYLRAPRSYAYMGLSLGLDSLALFRRWRAAGGSWEDFVAASGDPAAAALLAWDEVAAEVSAEP